MKSRKHIALWGMVIIFVALAICMNYFVVQDTIPHEVFNIDGICINEVCSNYFPTSFAETQPASDWIELYNASDQCINLGNYYLSDDKNDLMKCNLPAVELMPGCYYVIHSMAENEPLDEREILNFKISAQGETLYLSKQEGVLDIVNVPKLNTNTAWSRLADAGGDWGRTELSYGFSNNQSKQIQEKIEPPDFSVPGGFYAKEFELTLSAPNESTIYYTLDGSDPSIESTVYEGPVLIEDMSENADVYFTHTGIKSVNKSDKMTVVRAMAIDADGRKSDVETNSYLIGKEDKICYKEMYTVSLVTDPYNLFDDREGIYVRGKEVDEYVAQGGDLHDLTTIDCNYQIKGKRSERPANLEIFNEKGESILAKKVGIRIHGGTTRNCTQKSFSVYARDMYDGENTIEGLFGEDTVLHKFFIYTNREGTKLRDVLVSEMLADRNMATQSLKYCNVFLDGEYWGIYLLAEVYDEYYFENHYGIGADNIQISELTPPLEVYEYLKTVPDKSETEVYENLCKMIDIQSFIEYYASMLYLNDSDWLNYNARCYRSVKTGPGKNEDGKWRWGVWDVETTMYDASANTFHEGNMLSWEDDALAQALMEHEEFRKQFVITYMDLYNNIWQEDRILPIVSELESNITQSYAMYIERFWEGENINEFTDKLKKFLLERKDYAFEHVKEEFKLNADPAWLVILSNKEGAASFKVNTTTINFPATWWQGLDFPDYPVEVVIEKVQGDNRFLGWYTEDNKLLGTENTLIVNLNEETNIICARFAFD